MTVEHPRRIRSFVRRPGRITTGQRLALEHLLPRFGIAFSELRMDLDAEFSRQARRILDIGFGDGEALVSAAAAWPDIDYLGIEVHEPGVGHLLQMTERAGLSNVRVVDRDAVDVIDCMLADSSFDAVNLFFPDPWPKKRHHKRRIVQPEFIAAVSRILKPGGVFHFATDWMPYAEHTVNVLGSCHWFEKIEAAALNDEAIAFRAPTKFEARGRRLGHDVVDYFYRLRGNLKGSTTGAI